MESFTLHFGRFFSAFFLIVVLTAGCSESGGNSSQDSAGISSSDLSTSMSMMSVTGPDVDSAFKLMMDEFVTELQLPAGVTSATFTNHYYSFFVHNEKDGDDYAGNFVHLVNHGMPPLGDRVNSASHTGYLERLTNDVGVEMYFNTITNRIDPHVGLPIYQKKGNVTITFMSGTTMTVAMDDPHSNLDGYVIETAPNTIEEVGNLKKFDITLRAVNEQGKREIDLYIDDADRGDPGELFYINSVRVDVSDDGLDLLSDIVTYPGGGVFKTNCTLAEAEAANDPFAGYQCLNTFVLFYQASYDKPYWGPVHAPNAEGDIEKSFIIPDEWFPDENTEFIVTINYDHGPFLGIEESFVKKLGTFPSSEYLAKLMFGGDPNNLVDGVESIGDNDGLNLFWRFRETNTHAPVTLPAESRIKISLWDPVHEVDLEDFKADLDSTQRSTVLSGDLSAHHHLELKISLEFEDGSQANSRFHLVKRSGFWKAYPFSYVGLKEQYYTDNNKILASVVSGTRNIMTLESAFGRLAESIDLFLDPGFTSSQTDIPDGYHFNYTGFNETWTAVDGGDNRLVFESLDAPQELGYTYNPYYLDGDDHFTISYEKLYDASSDHQVSALSVTYDGVNLIAEWSEPIDTSTFNPEDYFFDVRYSLNYGAPEISKYRWGDVLRFESPLLGPSADDIIQVDIGVNHYDGLISGYYKLTCRYEDVEAGTCEK